MNKHNIPLPTRSQVRKYVFDNFNICYSCEYTDFCTIIDSHFSKDSVDLVFLKDYQLEAKTWNNLNYSVFKNSSSNHSSFDIELNIFIWLSGITEYNTPKDKHDRIQYKYSITNTLDVSLVPIVNILYELIVDLFEHSKLTIKRIKPSTPIVFTHDIDQLRSGWFTTIKYEWKHFRFSSLFKIPQAIITKIFGLKDLHFKGFEKSIALNIKHNINGIYFFMSKKSHSDSDYDIALLDKALKLIPESMTIGLHPGYDTYTNLTEFKCQKEILEKKLQTTVDTSRQHFLRYSILKTPSIQESLEIKEDYSLGFAEQYGFRNGVCSPFYLFDFEKSCTRRVKQVPLYFMDSTLTDYLNPNDQEKNKQIILENLSLLSKLFPLQVSVLFHNTSFVESKYSNFNEFYTDLISLNLDDKN